MHFTISDGVGEVTVEGSNATSVTLIWSDTVPDADGYYFELTPLDPDDAKVKNDKINDTSARRHTVNGLDPGTEYNVSVGACTPCTGDDFDTGVASYAEAKTSKFQ